jgi:hypothetical protein
MATSYITRIGRRAIERGIGAIHRRRQEAGLRESGRLQQFSGSRR